jgi:RimJ/RimL family protein N-acetyltransferase
VDASLKFALLTGDDAARLAALLSSQDPSYMKGFIPFAFEADAIRRLLSSPGSDRYWGAEIDDRLVGLVMLRFQQGYRRPSFGLAVSETHSGSGIGAAALDFALQWCRGNGIDEVMLKVASDNLRARRLYESRGFAVEATCRETGHLIQSIKLSAA